jgi:hypothetical protein
MKRLGMAAVLAASAMTLASAPAQAKKPAGETWGPIELKSVGDELLASGEASLTEVVLVDIYSDESGSYYWECYTARLRVDCRNLTPGATYSTPAGTFTANSRGKTTVAGEVYFEVGYFPSWDGWPPVWRPWPYVVDVVRLDPTGTSTRVLAGGLFPPSPWDR